MVDEFLLDTQFDSKESAIAFAKGLAGKDGPLTETPQFTHDCDRCTFLGRYENEGHGQSHDLYWCNQGGTRDTVIARWGNDGPQYISGLPFVGQVPAITEAHRLAVEKGLIKEPATLE